MAKSLIIVESPAKTKTLRNFLGSSYALAASYGHIRDLPKRGLGVNISQDFAPHYQIIPERRKIVEQLKETVKNHEEIFLASDPDREGEAIAWHLVKALEIPNPKRIEFNEITKEAVLRALASPREIDMNRVYAQQARRILDRLVGYKLSPLLWDKVKEGLSAGRVQSVAVKLICEREREIENFVPEEYWSITGIFTPKETQASFEAKLYKINSQKVWTGEKEAEKAFKIKDQNTADELVQKLRDLPYLVSEITKRDQKRNPPPPFITSTLQQDASRKLGFSAQKTMRIAQQLYEGLDIGPEGSVGLITYMRTDSVRVAEEAQIAARKYIEATFGREFIPEKPRVYKSRKGAQEAHEAIRPTSVKRTPKNIKGYLTPDQFKLYELIWKRFLASQMEAALLAITTVEVEGDGFTFRATGTEIKFPGFMIIYQETREEREEEEKEMKLPELEKGEGLNLLNLIPKQHFTQPPPRYTEASLVKALEEKGIGRPSTYAPILQTIRERGYVYLENKKFKPTDFGFIVTDLLVSQFPDLINVEFTADMETKLDKIEEGKLSWLEVLREFYFPFQETLKRAFRLDTVSTGEVCPQCGQQMVVKKGRYGPFLACSGYPQCKITKPLEMRRGEKKAETRQISEERCEKCGKPMLIKQGRYGEFFACSGFPECKNIKPIWHKIEVKCPLPECQGEIVERKTKRGRPFYGCSNYPDCKFSLWFKPTGEKCPNCGSLMVEKPLRNKSVGIQCSSCNFKK